MKKLPLLFRVTTEALSLCCNWKILFLSILIGLFPSMLDRIITPHLQMHGITQKIFAPKELLEYNDYQALPDKPEIKNKVSSIFEPFPFPDALAPQVAFWREIFTKYTTNHLVIHDNWYLPVIYEVIDISGPEFGSKAAGRQMAEATKKQYETILSNLSEKWDNLNAMTITERKIYELFKQYPESIRFKKQDAKSRVRIQVGQADRVREGLIQAGVYFESMWRIFSDRGLPETFIYSPMIESGFNIEAESYLGASGLWQFMRGTGKDYGLVINAYIDERKDPLKATKAAMELLWHNYQSIQSWPLAITAYNHGLQGMKNAVNAVGSSDIATIIEYYTGERFKFASRNFYPEFLAAIEVGLLHTNYFGKIELSAPRQLVQFTLPDYVSAKTLETYTQFATTEIAKFNPALRTAVFDLDGFLPKHYDLNIPKEYADVFATAYTKIPQNLKLSAISIPYHVKKGETLSTIAQKYNMSGKTLATINNISSRSKIKIGKILFIPINFALTRETSLDKTMPSKTMLGFRKNHQKSRGEKKGRSFVNKPYGKIARARQTPFRKGKKISTKMSLTDSIRVTSVFP